MHDVSPARAAALAALTLWRTGGPGARPEELISGLAAVQGLDARDRALAHGLFYGVIRNLIRLDHILAQFINRDRGTDPEVQDALRIAAYQLVFLDRVPAHAAVNDAVEQVKAARGRGPASFANAVLRAMLRGMDKVYYPDPEVDPVGYLCMMHSFPDWIAKRWVARFGVVRAGALMAASNSVPPLTLRVNTIKTTREELAERLDGAGVGFSFTRYAPGGITVAPGTAVFDLPGYAEGLFSVQDEAAQLAGLLMGPRPGGLVLDACAAPGGKATHIAELSGGGAFVLAADIGLDKSRRMKDNINRLGNSGVRLAVFDASMPLPLSREFDAAMLDAPCSALGIIRRQPEVKYLRREQDVARLSELQTAMLANVSCSLRPGGTLVYSVCSTEPEEGERVVEGFLAGNPVFELDDAGAHLPPAAADMITVEGYMRSLPDSNGTDGFFAARLARKR